MPVRYRRSGWSDERIAEENRKGNIRVRTQDVGRPKHHYIHMYYYAPNKRKRGILVKTTYEKYKR